MFTRLSLLLLLLAADGVAAELQLRPFNADYELYKGGMHLANTRIALEKRDNHWRWSTSTRARSLYAWFNSKQPYTRTSFIPRDGDIQLRRIIVGDASSETHHESARFNWAGGKMDVERKGKQWQINLERAVYDYQSIHLLAASMRLKDENSATIDFYRKGKLVKSRLVYSGKDKVKIGDESLAAIVFEQVISRSNTRIRYFYDAANPILPLRIEKLESGESPAVLSLTRVDWAL